MVRWPRRPPRRWPILATATSTFCMAMARAAGRRTRPMTRSLSPPAARRFPNRSKHQLKIGGRLVIPVGADLHVQELVRVTRIAQNEYRSEELADVRFVPLLGEEGWAPDQAESPRVRYAPPAAAVSEEKLVNKIAAAAEPFGFDRHRRSWPAAGAGRRCACRPARRGKPRHFGILPDARAHLPRAYSSRRASASSPSRATGRTPRASIIMCGISNILPPNGRRLPDSRPGCGATTRCVISSTGCASTMRRTSPRRGWRFTASISTACMYRLARC